MFQFASNCNCGGLQLIHRNVGRAVAGNRAWVAIRQPLRRLDRRTNKQTREKFMSAAGQAFILTAELFALSFAAIFVIWFADRVRRNFFGMG
jgi:hypothetical protein